MEEAAKSEINPVAIRTGKSRRRATRARDDQSDRNMVDPFRLKPNLWGFWGGREPITPSQGCHRCRDSPEKCYRRLLQRDSPVECTVGAVAFQDVVAEGSDGGGCSDD